MTTIYDVAARAQVSPATVSRVLNGGRVSADRAARVMRAAAELDFHPNRNARRLRTQTSELIGMLIPDIENSYFTIITRTVEDLVGARGYALVLCNTDENPDKEAAYLRALISEPVAGIICAPASPHTSFDQAVLREVPVVCLDRAVDNPIFDSLVVNNVPAARESTQMLFDEGYSRVACVSGPAGMQTADSRVDGFAQAWQDHHGSAPPPHFIERTAYTISGGLEATEKLLALPDPPDAIFAANNRLAVGVLRALDAAGLNPPQIGVFSFGELPLLTYPPEGLLISSMPRREMGTRAAQLLLDRLDGADLPPQHLEFQVDVSNARSVAFASGVIDQGAVGGHFTQTNREHSSGPSRRHAHSRTGRKA